MCETSNSDLYKLNLAVLSNQEIKLKYGTTTTTTLNWIKKKTKTIFVCRTNFSQGKKNSAYVIGRLILP